MSRYSSREDTKTGWYASKSGVPNARLHMCFPPKAYPTEVGPGDHTRWQCPASFCGILWRPEGIQVVEGTDYPVDGSRRDVILGPERWRFAEYTQYIHNDGPTGVMRAEQQELHYDWRPIAPYYVKLLRRIIEALGMGWKDL
jgi:hypothetical protein